MLMKLKKMSLREGASIIVATRERSHDSAETMRSRMSWLRMGTSTSLAEFSTSMPLELMTTGALAVSVGAGGLTHSPLVPIDVVSLARRLSMSWSAARCELTLSLSAADSLAARAAYRGLMASSTLLRRADCDASIDAD